MNLKENKIPVKIFLFFLISFLFFNCNKTFDPKEYNAKEGYYFKFGYSDIEAYALGKKYKKIIVYNDYMELVDFNNQISLMPKTKDFFIGEVLIKK